MAENFDLDELRQLTEECDEVRIMWFNKEGWSLGDPNGMPEVMPALLEELRLRRVVFRNMKVDEAMRWLADNRGPEGIIDLEGLADALKMTATEAAALLVVLEYANMIEPVKPGERN